MVEQDTENKGFMQASNTPLQDIQLVAYSGQPENFKKYKSGFESFMNSLHILRDNDEDLQLNLQLNTLVMNHLAKELKQSNWISQDFPQGTKFDRTIIAIVPPTVTGVTNEETKMVVKENPELIVARFRKGFSTPVHGHSVGFLYENILYGKLLVNTYRLIDPVNKIVRVAETTIIKDGEFVNLYTENNPENTLKRQTLIHNFKAIEDSASLHFIPEHTRDGRDNNFKVEYFEDVHQIIPFVNTERITSHDGMYLNKGDVVLVRSQNVPEYGDHFIIVTGSPVIKEHGLRVQDRAYSAPNTKEVLDKVEMQMGLVLLKLNKELTKEFHKFHNIEVVNNEVIFNN